MAEMTLEELVVRIKADTAQLDRALAETSSKTKQSTDKMGGAFSTLTNQLKTLIPAITIGSMVAFTKSAIDAAGRIKDLSDQIGFAASSLAVLEKPLIGSGGSLDGFAASVGILNNQLGEAVNGNQAAIKAFDDLGLSVRKLDAMSPEDRFYAVVQALSELETQSELTERGRNLLGRGFASMIPLIKESNGELKKFVDTQKDLQEGLSDKQIERLDALGDAISGMALDARNAVAGGLADLLTWIDEFDAKLKKNGGIFGIAQNGNGQFAGTLGGAYADAAMAAKKAANDNTSSGFYTDATTGITFGTPPMVSQYGPVNSTPVKKANPAAGSNPTQSSTKTLTKETKELSNTQRDAMRIIEMTRTAQERYNAEMENASKLLRDGFIDDETFVRYQQEMQKELDDTKDSMKKAGERTEIFAIQVKDYLGDAFESAIFDAESFDDALGSILDGIARKLARAKIIDPLSESLGGFIDGIGGDILGSLGIPSYDVGTPYVQSDHVAMIHKGEAVLTPRQADAWRSGNGGGITLIQNINVSPGVPELIQSEIQRAAPSIAAMGYNMVSSDLERGGNIARQLGKR